MSIGKTIHVPVSAESWGGSFVYVEAPGRSALHVTKPTEFGGPSGSYWSPEELLVNALASCYAITLEPWQVASTFCFAISTSTHWGTSSVAATAAGSSS